MYTETDIEITINGRRARIIKILYNLGLYECLDAEGRKFYVDENATIEMNGTKVRAFDPAVLNYCESRAALDGL